MARPPKVARPVRSVSPLASTERRAGTVKRCVRERGFGFILDGDGEEFFYHRADLENCEFESLLEGASVTFVPTSTAKGARAVEVRIV